MPRGLPIAYIKRWGISKKAWREFRKGTLTKGVRTRTPAIKRRLKKEKKSRRKPRVAKKKRRRGGKSMQRTVFSLLRLAALVGPGAVAATKGKTLEERLSYVLAKYTGYEAWNEKFNPAQLVEGYGPFLVTCLITYGIPKLTSLIRRL